MKNKHYFSIILILAICIAAVVSFNAVSRLKKNRLEPLSSPDSRIAVAYVTSTFDEVPDPTLMTHIFYAFGNITESYDSLEIEKPEKLQHIISLKDSNPDLKVCLAIQTKPRDGFSKMTASDSLRAIFVANCKKIVERYNLDGLNLDWEFPGTNAGMHQGGSPNDQLHYSYLARDLRKALDPEKELSFYSSNFAKYNDLALMEPYVDYVMVSGYNLGNPPDQHQSNLYPSKLCGKWSVSESVNAHISKGIPNKKIVIGIPFYARTQKAHQKEYGLSDNYVARRLFQRFLPDMKIKWDKTAKAPYFADKNGRILAAFDNEKSIAEKAKYIKDNGLAGAFYWHYDCETDPHPLARSVYDNLKK